MHSSSLLLTSLLYTLISAAPAAPTTPSPDACGPVIQGAQDPRDSCRTAPSISPSPASFGIAVFDTAPLAPDFSSCDIAINSLCTQTLTNATVNAWHFATSGSGANLGFDECQIGVWVPGEPVVKGAAPKPSAAQCSSIFGAMRDAAAGPKAGGATINLIRNPAGQPDQGQKLPAGVDGVGETGKAVNLGYPSYALSVVHNAPKPAVSLGHL